MMSCDFGHVGRLDVPVVVEGERGVLVLAMATFSKSPKTSINSIDLCIQFTVEETRPDGSMPFLDTLVMPQPDGTLATTVCKKSIQTHQYLLWDSHHTISAKYNVVSQYTYSQGQGCVFQPTAIAAGKNHLQELLTTCKYPLWALHRMIIMNILQSPPDNNSGNQQWNTSTSSIKKKIHITVLCTKGLSGSFKKACCKHEIQVYFKGR